MVGFKRQNGTVTWAEEIESHLQLHVEHNLRAGMTPEDARRSGRRCLPFWTWYGTGSRNGCSVPREQSAMGKTTPGSSHLLRPCKNGCGLTNTNRFLQHPHDETTAVWLAFSAAVSCSPAQGLRSFGFSVGRHWSLQRSHGRIREGKKGVKLQRCSLL